MAGSLPAGGRVREAESLAAVETRYELPARAVVVTRVEADLVCVYRQTLPAGAVVKTIRSSSLAADLYVQIGRRHDLVEAKAAVKHSYVRQALGQLLDYAKSFDAPIAMLTALFPSEPAAEDIDLLNHYGIDCLFADRDASEFVRRSASEPNRRCWRRPVHGGLPDDV